jgi:glutathione S-transferase
VVEHSLGKGEVQSSILCGSTSTEFLRGRVVTALGIVDGHLAGREYMVGGNASTADLSMCGYLYFGDELSVDLAAYPNVQAWLGRIAALPGWKHPYDLMPRAFEG